MQKALHLQIIELVINKQNHTPLRGILAQELIVINELISKYEKQKMERADTLTESDNNSYKEQSSTKVCARGKRKAS
jgi:hypothetical protein